MEIDWYCKCSQRGCKKVFAKDYLNQLEINVNIPETNRQLLRAIYSTNLFCKSCSEKHTNGIALMSNRLL